MSIFKRIILRKKYPKKKIRDDCTRTGYKKLLEEDDINGFFIRDILREKITENDPRLQ